MRRKCGKGKNKVERAVEKPSVFAGRERQLASDAVFVCRVQLLKAKRFFVSRVDRKADCNSFKLNGGKIVIPHCN